MVKMMRAERPRARPPNSHPPFHQPPVGSTDRWMIVENFVVRVHCKLRYQRCHPIHSSYPLRDEQVLMGRRVTIKYIAAEVVSYYMNERPVGEWVRRTETLPPHLRIPLHMRGTEAAQVRAHRMTRAASSGHGHEFATTPAVVTPTSAEGTGGEEYWLWKVGCDKFDGSPFKICCVLGIHWINGASFKRAGSWVEDTKAISKPPPSMPPAERWADAPDGLLQALEALTDSEKNCGTTPLGPWD